MYILNLSIDSKTKKEKISRKAFMPRTLRKVKTSSPERRKYSR